ncbi:MAG: hypothetical protein AAB377_00390 [Patescibacteria group bacterium]
MSNKIETKNCQNCKNPFTIEPDDFLFYEKMKVPPPTWCPECRKQRRLSWRNDLSLYSRKCDLCNKNIISLYSPDGPMKSVYCQKCWWSDGWDPKSYAQEYDFSKSFFEQFAELQRRVPALAMVNDNGIGSLNCEYTQDFARSKNCYMVFIAWKLEECLYSVYLLDGKEIVDSLNSMGECEAIYETVYTEKCYRCRNVYYSVALSDCNFCWDCRDCSDCFLSVGIRHKRYCFKNKEYTKEEYNRILAEYRLDTHAGAERAMKELLSIFPLYPRKFSSLRNCVNCTGDALINGKNSRDCFNVQRPEDCRWVENSDTPKASYDLSVGGELDQCYEGITPDHSYRSRFSIFSWKNTEVSYVDGCHSSKDIFGCCGLKKAQYCVLNKQYSKEEYEELISKIKKQMDEIPYIDSKGRTYKHGEFFPTELSYFAYNETVAQDFFPITQKQAEEEKICWQEHFQVTTGKETISLDKLPESISDVSDTILNETLRCSLCARNYRIVPSELMFYRKMRIPIPHNCFHCRAGARFGLRNPFSLWHRQCQCSSQKSENGIYQNTVKHQHREGKCPNEFETSYSPDRKEIVYCESCYNAEVV